MSNYKNRGINLEKIINNTIRYYVKNNWAIIHKKSVPIKIKKMLKINQRWWITSAIVTEKSTIDYYGIYKGRFIGFEAKSTISSKFWINNIASHQWKYLIAIKQQNAITFCLIGFEKSKRYFIIDFETLMFAKTKALTIYLSIKLGYELTITENDRFNLLEIIDKLIVT